MKKRPFQKVWLNHRLVRDSEAKISVWDRGFLYGDGIYEAVRVYNGKIFHAEDHWKRMDRSMEGIGFKIPWRHKDLTRACRSVVKGNHLKECLLRITISRGVGKLGYAPSPKMRPTLSILASPVRNDLSELWEKGVKISIVTVRRNHLKSLSPAIKHTNSLNGILAKRESLKSGAFEGIFLNLEGHVAEGTISNIFMVKNGCLKTPSLSSGILDGVTRRLVLKIAKKSRIPISQTQLRPSELSNADEIFLTSTTMEVMPVVAVGRKRVGRGVPGPITLSLHGQFRKLIDQV